MIIIIIIIIITIITITIIIITDRPGGLGSRASAATSGKEEGANSPRLAAGTLGYVA